jgi:hypothetical protein
MTALPSLLDGNAGGKAQALQYGVLPLLVHLLRSSPSPTTVAAAAASLAVLADRDTELQGQITAAGGLSALLDRLDPEAAASSGAPPAAQAAAAQAAAATAAAAAAATAAAEAVAKAAQERAAAASASAGGAPAADGGGGAESGAVDGHGNSSNPATAPAAGQQLADSDAAAAMAAANVAAADASLAAAAQRLASIRVRSACLRGVAALAHDNSFTKNTARQQGVMAVLRDMLSSGAVVLQAAVFAGHGHGSQQQQRQQHLQQQQRPISPASSNDLAERLPGNGVWPHAHLRVRTLKAQPAEQQQEEAAQERAAQLAMLAAAVAVLVELCHGNNSNQQAAAAEGLLDAVVSLAAVGIGNSLAVTAQHVGLLAALLDALAAAVEFCAPNRLAAREAGAIDVCSRLLLMAAEVGD